MRGSVAVVVAVLTFTVAACSMIEAIERGPKECSRVFDRARCLAIADVMTAEISKTRADVSSIAIIPDPTPGGMRLGGPPPIHIVVMLNDGSVHDSRICGLLSLAPACTNNPTLMAKSIRSAYTDVPCGADPAPGSCATPVPSAQPEAIDAAVPIVVESEAIHIDHIGRFEVPLGEGSLPNGLLSEASFEFGEAWPDDVALRDGAAWLGVESLEPDGKAFDNRYTHGWRPGVERVRAVLTFEVLWFAPGATLEIRNVVVR